MPQPRSRHRLPQAEAGQRRGLHHLPALLGYGRVPLLLEAIRNAGIWLPVDVGIMPILDQAATINMALSRNGCVMDRKLCEIISKNWIFPNPFDKEPFDADVAGKKESFRKAGIEYTINQIDEYRACGVDGIHLYALNKYDDVAYIAKEAGLIDLV